MTGCGHEADEPSCVQTATVNQSKRSRKGLPPPA
jgi:hypothetical protein